MNTIRRRIEHLEHELDCPLLLRSSGGVELTNDGRRVFTVGLEMLEYAQALGRLPMGASGLAGKLKLGVTEGVGTFWIVPRLVEFFEEYPQIQIDLRCEMRVPDISRLEVDLAVQLDRPRDPNLIVTRLGYLHLGLFATREYLDKHGEPETMMDVANGRFIHLVADQIPSQNLAGYVEPRIPDEFINLKCNTSSAQAYAIARGSGVGVLPTYSIAVSRRLVPVMEDMTIKRDVWLVCHPDLAKTVRAKALIKWLKKSFKFPWFGEDYIRASELMARISENKMEHMFEGIDDPPALYGPG